MSLAVAALVAGTTDLRGIVAGTAGTGVWATPGARARRGRASRSSSIAETGRQPVDNPDTHLELTMIHEGPLLEYAGRDLAYLQWAAAARHWLVLVLAAQVFLPHPHGVWLQLAVLPVALVVLCAALAIVETLVAKMRILLVPRLLAVGVAAALLGIAAWIAGAGMSGALLWMLVALGLTVVVVRRRSVAVALVTAQALVLVGFALYDAARRRGCRRRGRARGARGRPRGALPPARVAHPRAAARARARPAARPRRRRRRVRA